MQKILAFLMLLGYTCFAQKTVPNSFILKNVIPAEKESFYREAIEQANMEKYRLQDEDITLTFDNGFECVMLSAKSLFLKGISINPKDYAATTNKSLLPLFSVLPDKRLAARIPNAVDNKKFSQ